MINSEIKLTKLLLKNKSHDQSQNDLIGIFRGLSIQLYGTNKKTCQKLTEQIGKNIDRNSTTALFSFGRLGPNSISFSASSEYCFNQRKTILIHVINNNIEYLSQIAYRNTKNLFIKNESNQIINISELLTEWTQNTTGEFIWGKDITNYNVNILGSNYNLEKMWIMKSLDKSFQDLYKHSKKIWNRIYFPLSKWPITINSCRLLYNVKIIQNKIEQIMKSQLANETKSIAMDIYHKNIKFNISINSIRDDLIITTLSGLNIIKLTIMSILYHLLDEKNKKWKVLVLNEIKSIFGKELNSSKFEYKKLSECKILNDVIFEVLRYESANSLLNNQSINDFDLIIDDKIYKIKKGTYIMSNIYLIHHDDSSWPDHDKPLETFDPSRFIDKNIINSNFFLPFECNLLFKQDIDTINFTLTSNVNFDIIPNKHNTFSREIIQMLNDSIGQKSYVEVYPLHNYIDNIDYGVVIFGNQVGGYKRIIVRGIKAKYINKIHVELIISILIRRLGRNWRKKLVIVCRDDVIVKDEARLNKVVFIRLSDMLYFFSLEI
ncbi:5763_t:CDS:2 [Scutellospora calospora]|uniref:5763_t:CDS:1 n=1 Tax=Scutellospora calospora TaxID=85575 RepID=A0ACA9L652_9GLOM|nr:5763_t:CDS:2 [Scutellospora calospora]